MKLTNHKVYPINLDFKGMAMPIYTFMVESSEGLIIIESGPHSTIGNLELGLKDLGFNIDDVTHVLLTHIHLDHAGGAWCLAEKGAKIYVHPFGYAHMNDPSKLLASAKKIYGESMDSLWGTLKSIPSDRLFQVEDEAYVKIGDLNFKAWHTPGHAKHHIVWQLDEVLFTGDLAGIRMDGGPPIPPLPPPDINIEDWVHSIERVLQINGIEKCFLTHGSLVEDCTPFLNQMIDTLKAYAQFIKPYIVNGTSVDEIAPHFSAFVKSYLVERGLDKIHADKFSSGGEVVADIHGLRRYWKKKLAID